MLMNDWTDESHDALSIVWGWNMGIGAGDERKQCMYIVMMKFVDCTVWSEQMWSITGGERWMWVWPMSRAGSVGPAWVCRKRDEEHLVHTGK